ncbi:MAG: hypothetical protein A2Z20_13020 [Bdellovibrionales bacterium RBG_16_40_8]|nr:MAG: hypothetical protein A2Z20_13020 [Bdellovibrionales bacterium RBG_16_40_8]
MRLLSNLSLKFKLILLLIMLTGTMLATYGYLALRDYEKDKVAYVLDSSLAYSRSVALQIRAESEYIIDKVKFLMRGYSINNSFHPFSETIFTQEKQFDACLSYSFDQVSRDYQYAGALRKNYFTDEQLIMMKKIVEKLNPTILQNEMAIYKLPGNKQWLLGLRFQQFDSTTNKQENPLIIISVLNSAHFLNFFETSQMQDPYLVDSNAEILMGPINASYHIVNTEKRNAIVHTFKNIKSAEGATKFQESKKSEPWLISMAAVGFGNLKIISIASQYVALEAVRLVIIKSALFIVFLFFITIFISVFASTGLTSSLKRLLAATREIASGNFAVSVTADSSDEIGALSIGFNKMTKEINRLMQETHEKARMAGELKTAKLVQSTLFPKEDLASEDLEICGFYEPASECSGDWWFYKRVTNQTIFCIGDATGHGVPAALLTSAARSVISTLDAFPDLPLAQMMRIFNRAIYNTANGQVMMTLFLGAYNHDAKVITYSNASHESPFLFPAKENIKKKDIILLNEAIGPRLGERPDVTYSMKQVRLNPGDRVVLYTDGVTELKNKEGANWGERPLIKILVTSCNENKAIKETINDISSELKIFREDYPLQDDVTYFMLSRPKSA